MSFCPSGSQHPKLPQSLPGPEPQRLAERRGCDHQPVRLASFRPLGGAFPKLPRGDGAQSCIPEPQSCPSWGSLQEMLVPAAERVGLARSTWVGRPLVQVRAGARAPRASAGRVWVPGGGSRSGRLT